MFRLDMKKTLSSIIPHSKGEAKLLGIDNLGDSAVIYRITCPVASNKQFEAERIMRKEIKKVLDQEQIKIPYPQIEVHSNIKCLTCDRSILIPRITLNKRIKKIVTDGE